MSETILVTGASGYVGSKIYADLKQDGHKVVGTYNSTKLFEDLKKCNLTNKNDIESLFMMHSPEVIIHVAANASNSSAEKDPEAAIDLNVNATRHLVEACKKSGAKFIFISTFAAYEANGVYGKTKLEAEQLVSKLDNYMILRPSLIIGLSPNIENDRPFNRILKNILENDIEVEYDNSWEFHPTFLSHLSQICSHIIKENKFSNLVFPVVTNKVASRYVIAKDILESFNIKVKPVDESRSSKEPEIDWGQYDKLGMPMLSYEEGITEIIKEINNLPKPLQNL